MSGKTIEVGMRISGDAKGAREAISATEKDLADLAASGRKIILLDGAAERAKELATEAEKARQKVQALGTAYSEALSAGGSDKQLKELGDQLNKAENEAARLAKAFDANAQSMVVLRRELRGAGIDVERLSAERFRIEQTARAVASVQGAFNTLNIRPAARIEAEINAINIALRELASRANVSGDEFDRAFAAGQQRIEKLRAELKGTPEEIDQVGKKVDGLVGMMKGLGVAFTGAELARQFITVNIELENIERSFIAVTGSTAKAAQEMEYAKGVANRLGVDVLATARSYSDLMAATKGTSVEGEITRKVFESVTRSMAIAGRTSAETAGALNALSQMAGKQIVQMEELRGQLGDRLPGALGATAEGLGITTAQLIKLVEAGQMTAEELFPALSAGLEKLYGQAAPTETMSQRWAHFKNGIVETFGAVADTGVWATLSIVLGGVTEVVMILATGVTTVTAGFFALVKALAVTTAAVVNMDFSHLKEELQGISEEMLTTINRVASLTQVSKILKPAMDETGQAHKGAKDATAEHNKALTQLKSGYAYATEAAAEATKQTQANVEAKNAEATATLAAANAFGNETQKLMAKADATRVAAAGSAELAERRKDELALAKANLAAIQDEVIEIKKSVAARGGDAAAQEMAVESQQKVIDTLRKTVDARQADADKAQAQAQSSAVVAAQAEAEANAHADNSGRVLELKAAYEQAALAADVLRAQKSAGIDVGNALTDADLRAGKAAKLYQDALSDQTAAIQRNLSVKEAGINVEQAGIRLAIEQQRTIMDVARARGDERGAIEALLKIKQLEIQLAELTAKAKAAEAEAALEMVKAKRAELEAAGQLTAAKEAELKAQEAGAKVKQIEGQIAGETAKRMRELADAYRQTGGEAAGANRGIRDIGESAESSVPGVDRLTDSLNRMNGARRGGGSMAPGGASALETPSLSSDPRQNELGQHVDNNGNVIKDTSGNPVTNSTSLLDMGHQADQGIDIAGLMYRKGASPEDVKAAQKYFGELYARQSQALLNGVASQGQANMMTRVALNNALEQSLALAKQERETGQQVDLGRSVADINHQKFSTADFSRDYAGTDGVKHQQRLLKDAAMEAQKQPIKTIKIDLSNGKDRASLWAEDQAAADKFLQLIDRDRRRAGP